MKVNSVKDCVLNASESVGFKDLLDSDLKLVRDTTINIASITCGMVNGSPTNILGEKRDQYDIINNALQTLKTKMLNNKKILRSEVFNDLSMIENYFRLINNYYKNNNGR